MLVFTRGEWALVRQGKKYAQLMPSGGRYAPRRLEGARRIVPVHDEDHAVVGTRVEAIEETEVAGRRRAVLTVTAVEDVDVFAPDSAPAGRVLAFADARACGYKTLEGLRAAWRSRHPRSELAKLVWFVPGDARDRDLFLNWTGRAGGDYTRNPQRAMDSDAPALTPEQYRGLGLAARQKVERDRAARSVRLSGETDAQRMARIEAAAREIGASFRRELGVAESRILQIERRSSSRS